MSSRHDAHWPSSRRLAHTVRAVVGLVVWSAIANAQDDSTAEPPPRKAPAPWLLDDTPEPATEPVTEPTGDEQANSQTDDESTADMRQRGASDDSGSSLDPSLEQLSADEQQLLDQTLEDTSTPTLVDDKVDGEDEGDSMQPISPSAVEQKLKPLLDKHAFCQDDDYRIPFGETGLCEYSEAARKRCPGIAKACSMPHQADETERKSLLEGLDLDVLGMLRMVVWGLIIIGITLIVMAIVRRMAAMKDSGTDEQDPPPEPPDSDQPPPSIPGETDVDRLLARARQAAERGNFVDAIRDAYAALLRKLDQDGLIEVHRSKTNGDYRRSLAKSPDLQAQFTQIVRAVEGVQFGSQSPTPQTFQSLLQRILPLLQRTGSLLVLLLAAALSTGCHQLDQRPRATALGCGESPGGYSVLCEMLGAQGSTVRRRIREIDKIDSDVSKIVVLDEALLTSDEWERLDEWVQDGHTLVLAAVPNPISKTLDIERSRKPCTTTSSIVEGIRSYYGEETKLFSRGGRALEIDSPTSWVLTRCDAGPTLVGTTHGEGTVLVLPSSTFLKNVSLAAADNAYFAVNVFARTTDKIEVVGDWTGSGSTTPFEALKNANLSPWLLQLLVVAGLLALWRGPHFGQPRDPVEAKRHAFVEHLQALGLKYARSKASRHVLANYGNWAIARLHERLLPGTRASVSELAGVLARLTERNETEVLQILIAAKSAQDEAHDTATPDEHLHTMKELESLVKAAGGTR